MGVFNFKQIWVFFILIAAASFEVGGDDSVTKTRSSPPPSNNSEEKTQTQANFSPFKQPSIVVIVGVLTTIFSIALLLLLYAKHCKREISQNAVVYGNHAYAATTGTGCRKNSGIERGVIESLPIFRFSSLTGQKDGLECAVCLARFEATEVLRLLPKCKHAFHVECVDTWLDSHSTCPLCRHRVHPEDILLNDNLHPCPGPGSNPDSCLDTQESESGQQPNFMFNRRRVSGRHSSAGELTTSSNSHDPSSFRSRKSLDSARFRFSYKTTKKNESTTGTVAVACFDHRSPPRKDCLLLTGGLLADRESFERRFEHRIVISAGSEGGGFLHQRWSDVHPPDLLYLRSEMIISDSRRFSSSHSRPSWRRLQQHQQQQMLVVPLHNNNNNTEKGMDIDGGGRSIVIKSRSVSEITGLSRFPNNRESNCNSNTNSIIINRNSSRQRQRQRQAEAGLISRWLAWISSSHSQSQSQSELLPTVRANL